jgi:hypothetical protein
MTQSMVQKFNFVDFEPSAGVAKRSMEKLHRIFGESPSDSSTRAILRKTRAGFVAKREISASDMEKKAFDYSGPSVDRSD